MRFVIPQRALGRIILNMSLAGLLTTAAACSGVEEVKDPSLAEQTKPEPSPSAKPETPAAPETPTIPEETLDPNEIEVSEETGIAISDGVASMMAGDFDAARAKLKKYANDADAGHLANYNLGVLEMREGNLDLATEYFRASLQKNSNFTPALVSLTRAMVRSGKPGVAAQTAERYANENPENLGHLDAWFQVLVLLGRHEEVIKEAKKTLRKDERNIPAMVNMASAFQQLGKFELAETILLQVVELAADNGLQESYAHYLLGFVYMSMKRDRKAIAEFESAVDLRPDFVEARNNLGVLYHNARDYGSAIEQFEAAVALYPTYKEAHLNLGNAQKGSRLYEDAEKSFKNAVRIDTEYALAYFNLGVLYLDGEFDGRDRKEQFQNSIDNFNRYKTEMKAGVPRDDPSDRYIEEARKKIELEKKREQQEREAAMEPEEFPEDEFPEDEEFPGENGGGADGGDEEFPEEEEGEEFPEEDK